MNSESFLLLAFEYNRVATWILQPNLSYIFYIYFTTILQIEARVDLRSQRTCLIWDNGSLFRVQVFIPIADCDLCSVWSTDLGFSHLGGLFFKNEGKRACKIGVLTLMSPKLVQPTTEASGKNASRRAKYLK